MFGRLSLQARLIILLVAAILPLALLSVFSALRDMRRITEATQAQLKVTASLVAANQDRLIDSTRDLLTAISVMPITRQPGEGACQRYFENLKGRFPIYANIGLLRPDGQVRCHANARLGDASAADRAYFRQALASRAFVMGEPVVGRLSGKHGIPFALPVMDGDALTGVVFASMDLTQAAADLARLPVLEGARVMVTDRRAVVLMEFPPRPGQPAGRTLVDPTARRGASEGTSGVGEAADAEGVERVFAFAPSRDVAGEHFLASVSIESRQVTAASLSRLREDLFALALSLLAGLAGATWLARRGIVRPARHILDAVRRLERGSLDERLPLPQANQRDEFGRIAGAFNLMAESLQLRQRELDTELGRSHAAYSTLDLVLNSLQEALVAVTPAGGLLMFNEAAARLFPLRGPALLPQQWQARWGIYQADGSTPYPTQELPMVRAARGESAVEEMLFVRNELVPEGRLLHASYQPMQGDAGIVAGLVVFADVTLMQHLVKEQAAQVQQMKDIQRRLMEAQRVGRTGSWELDLRTHRLWWSDEVYELFGLERHDFDRSLEDFLRRVHPEDRPRLEAARAEAIGRETPMDVEYRIVVAGGGTLWMNERGEVRRDEAGDRVAFSGVVQDITQRKRSEADLVLLRNAIARLNDIVIISEYDGQGELDPRIVFTNQAFERLLGFTSREAVGMTPRGLGLYGPRTDRQTLQRMRDDLSRGDGTRGELVHCARDGRELWMEVVVVPMAASKGERAHLISVLRDVTARKEADEALKKNERELQEFTLMLQRTAEAAQVITIGQSIEGTMQAVVDQARAVIGAHQAVLSLTADRDWSQVVTALSLSQHYAAYRAMETMPDGTGIYAVVCESNKPLRLTQAAMEAHAGWRGFGAHAAGHPPLRGLLAVPLVDRAGRNAGLMMLSDKLEGDFNERDEYVAVEMAQLASIAIDNARLFEQVRDINAGLEARIAERTAELTRQEQLYRTLAEQAPEVIWNTDAQGHATFLNRAWYDLVGGTPGQWLGPGWLSRVHPDDAAEVQRNWAISRETLQPYSGVRRLRAGDGTYHTTSYKAAPVLDDQGQVAFWVGIDADITELKAIEHALRNSNEELQAFSYSVSHDLRAPLGAIAGFSQALGARIEGNGDARVQHYLARIQAGVEKMEELIDALLSLAQVARAPISYATVDLSAMAREALEAMLLQEPQRHVAVQVEDGLVAHGDVRLLRVVMQNLLGNAWKFTSKVDKAHIEVGRLGDSSVFFVRDNGVGFEMAYAHKLFGAFQRLHTEAEFPGTGIGLATVRRIIARHQGRVWAESYPGQGTVFFFTLSEAAPPAWLDAPR